MRVNGPPTQCPWPQGALGPTQSRWPQRAPRATPTKLRRLDTLLDAPGTARTTGMVTERAPALAAKTIHTAPGSGGRTRATFRW